MAAARAADDHGGGGDHGGRSAILDNNRRRIVGILCSKLGLAEIGGVRNKTAGSGIATRPAGRGGAPHGVNREVPA